MTRLQRSVRRIVAALGIASLVVVAVFTWMVSSVAPDVGFGRAASAQTTPEDEAEIDVELLSQSIQPTQPVLVRITVRAERAISGQLDLVPGVNEWGNPMRLDSEYRWDIDVAANTEVQTLALMPVSWDTNSLEARLTADGNVIAKQKKSINVGIVDDREQIGTFGVDSPARVAVGGAKANASVTKLDGLELVGPSLSSFSTIVADPAMLAGLGDTQRDVIAGWVTDGGQLALPNGANDLQAAGLGELDALRSGPIVGRGIVVAFGDATELSDDVLLANGAGSPQQMFGPVIWSDPVASLGQRSGLQLASIRSLAIFLGVYAFVAGPLAYAATQRLRRPRLLWAILPLTALVFTGVAALTGSVVRSAGHDEHTTIVMSRPSGSQAESYLLVRGGEDISVGGDWWVSAAQSEMVQQGPGALQFDVGAEKTRASVQVASGSAALLAATGPYVESDAGLQLTVVTNTGETLTGTVINNLAVDLHDTIVVWDGASADIGSIAAGETKEFTIEYKKAATNQWGEPVPAPEQKKWGMISASQNSVMAIGGPDGMMQMNVAVMDGPGNGVGAPPDGTIADGNIWAMWRSNNAGLFSRSQLVAIGWTDELASPTASIASGRTAFVAAIPTNTADTPAYRVVTMPGTEDVFLEAGPPVFQIRQRADFAEPIVAKDWGVNLERNTAGLAFDIDGEQRWVRFEEDDDGAVTVSLPDELNGATSVFITTSVSMDGPGPMGVAFTEGSLDYRDPEALDRKLDPGDKPVYRDLPSMAMNDMTAGMETNDPVAVPPLTVDAPYTDSGVLEPGITNVYTIKLNKNADVTIDMVASDPIVDPMLTLRNSEGANVASNDDVGGSTNSSLNFAGADAGTYQILAQSISAPGSYEITITMNDPGEDAGAEEADVQEADTEEADTEETDTEKTDTEETDNVESAPTPTEPPPADTGFPTPEATETVDG